MSHLMYILAPLAVHDHLGAIKSLSPNGNTMSLVNLIKLNLTHYLIWENLYSKLELESNEVNLGFYRIHSARFEARYILDTK